MLKGKYVTLRVIEKSDGEMVRQWKNSPENYNYFANRSFISDSRQDRWIESATNAPDALYLIIIDNQSGKPIGMTLLSEIDHRNRNACWGIYIAEAEFRRRIFAVEAVLLLFNYAFGYFNLRKIYGNTLESNDRGRKFHTSVGFKEEARFNEHVFADGKYLDLVWIAQFADDWPEIEQSLKEYVDSYRRE